MTFVERYKIDSSQNQFAFIFYNTQDRNGAEEEATNLHSALTDVGFTSTLTEWDDIGCLPRVINQKVAVVSSTASLVMVSIMSHGKHGTLSDSHGLQIPLNYILFQLKGVIPEEIPLVVVVQACQNFADLSVFYEESSDMALPATADNHVLLIRPHTALLMATVAGGTAKRGAYIGALAAELRKANGRIEIRAMHTNAANEVRRLGYQQTPECRDTLMKQLILQHGGN